MSTRGLGTLGLGVTALAIIALALGGCATKPPQAAPTALPVIADLGGVTAEGRLEPVRYVMLSPTVDGTVSAVLVSEGQQVQAGQVIARLESPGAQTLEAAQQEAAVELGLAHEALRSAQNEFDVFPVPRALAGLTPQEAARTWLAELDAANKVFAPYRDTSRKTLKPSSAFSPYVYPNLPRRVLIDTGEYEGIAKVYKKRVDAAWMNYTKAVLWLEADAAVTAARARLADAQRRYDSLQGTGSSEADAGVISALASAEIRAPFEGSVTNLDVKVGEAAHAGTPIATVADLSGWAIKTTDLTEIDVVTIQAGQAVTVILDSLPDITLRGVVTSVDLGYADREGDIVYAAHIRLTDAQPGLRWGMTGEIEFEQ